jgi:hypothetical protein
LSLTAEPGFDITTRTAQVQAGQPVTFHYVVDVNQREFDGVLKFGDGQQQTVQEVNGNVTHTYQCAEAECRYQVSLELLDEQNVTSPPTALTQLTVVVRQ